MTPIWLGLDKFELTTPEEREASDGMLVDELCRDRGPEPGPDRLCEGATELGAGGIGRRHDGDRERLARHASWVEAGRLRRLCGVSVSPT